MMFYCFCYKNNGHFIIIVMISEKLDKVILLLKIINDGKKRGLTNCATN